MHVKAGPAGPAFSCWNWQKMVILPDGKRAVSVTYELRKVPISPEVGVLFTVYLAADLPERWSKNSLP